MNTTELSKIRTELSNQRTYLSYMRTGFAISIIAEKFKKKYIVIFGIIMIIISSIQYYLINKNLKNDIKINNYFNYIPLLSMILSLLILYVQYK